MVQTTYTRARANLAELMDRATEDNEIIFVSRKKAAPVAIIAADELESLLETAHLLRSPKNRQRLFDAYQRAEKGEAKPSSIEELRKEMGLEKE